MPNFLGVLIKSIKGNESVKHQFMGDYGVVISIFNEGNLVWAESTWGMGLKELRRVVQWAGGRFTSKSVPLEDRGKRNIDLDKKTVLSTLLAWESEELGLIKNPTRPKGPVEADVINALHDLLPGQVLETHEPVTGASIQSMLKDLSETRFTGFIRVSSGARALVYIVGGKFAGAAALKDGQPIFGDDVLKWLAQQVDLKVERFKLDLFIGSCYAVPMLEHVRSKLPGSELEAFIKKVQTDIDSLYLIHLKVKDAHAFGLVYREVYAGTVAKKKGEATGSILPMAVLAQLSLLPGVDIEAYRFRVPRVK